MLGIRFRFGGEVRGKGSTIRICPGSRVCAPEHGPNTRTITRIVWVANS